jgi:hypothetical protein
MKLLYALAFLILLPICFGVADRAQAQRMYKYRDANGAWVYSDRQPGGGQEYQEEALQAVAEPSTVRVTQRAIADGLTLIATNTYFGPMHIAYQLNSMQNVAPGTISVGRAVLPARSETEFLTVARGDVARAMSFEYQFQYIPGDPGARHAPDRPYRLPYSAAESYRISQAYPDVETHADPSSSYAVDFEMPIGTRVYAARGGIVLEIARDFYQSGTDPEIDGPRANVVRVHHDDGTMALYAHLNWNSIRVVPGQRVARGEYIADSGNTGFSTGPHLHFAIQTNSDGSIVSVPVQFTGIRGQPVTLRAGDRPTAY